MYLKLVIMGIMIMDIDYHDKCLFYLFQYLAVCAIECIVVMVIYKFKPYIDETRNSDAIRSNIFEILFCLCNLFMVLYTEKNSNIRLWTTLLELALGIYYQFSDIFSWL